MSQVPDSNTSFGILIAYLLPGFGALVILGQYSPLIHGWLVSQPSAAPTVGGFLYATVASFALGLTLSTIRWFVLDPLHYATGIPRPVWNFAKLQEHIDAFQIAVDYHYRYYQSYGNSLIVLVVLTIFPKPLAGLLPGDTPVHRLCLALLAALFFLASRDAMRNYHNRATALRNKSRHVKERIHDQRFKDRKAARSAAQGTAREQSPQDAPQTRP